MSTPGDSAPEVAGVFSAGALTLSIRILVFGFSLVTNVLLARALGPSGRGLYTLALLVPSLMVLAANLGIQSAIVYYVGKGILTPSQVIRQALSMALILGTAAYAVQFVVMLGLGSRLLPGVDPRYVLVASLAVPFILAFNFLQTVFQAKQLFVDYNVIQVVSYAGLVVILLVALLAFHLGVWGAVVAWAVSSIPTLAACLYLARRLGPVGIGVDLAQYRSLLRFGIVGYAGSVTTFFNYRLDLFLVNLFGTARDVGLYAVGVGLAETIWYLSTAAATVLAPRVASGDPDDADELTGIVSRVVLVITLAACAGLSILAPLLVRVFFGPAFQSSVAAIWLLMPGVVALSVAKVLTSYLLGRNRLRIDFLAASVGLAATVGLDLALIPRFGFAGAAVASSIAYSATLVVSAGWVVRNSELSLADLLVVRRSDWALLASKLRGGPA